MPPPAQSETEYPPACDTPSVRPIDSIRFAMGRQPLVHLAAIPCLVLHRPGMARRGNFLRAGRACSDETAAMASGLPRRADRRRICHLPTSTLRVAKSAHARQRPKVVVERPVLLHQQHDMLDVPQRTILRWPLGQQPLHIGRHKSRCGSSGCHAPAPVSSRRRLSRGRTPSTGAEIRESIKTNHLKCGIDQPVHNRRNRMNSG